MKQPKRYTIPLVMLGIGAVALVFAFLVLRNQVKPQDTPSSSQNSTTQTSDQSGNPTPAPASTPETPPVDNSITGWQTYNNAKYGFSLQYPPNLKVGTVSGNSALGTFSAPVKGFHVGPLVLVVLKTADLKTQGKDYFNGYYNEALHPTTASPSDAGQSTGCTIDKINSSLNIKSVYCGGEGGAANYAYITGTDYDVFVDGYTKGYDTADFGSFTKTSDYVNILSTFKFGSQTTSTTTTPTPSVPAAPPAPASASIDISQIQKFNITADDNSATPSEVTVPNGSIVEITFNVSNSNVYHGGLDFRSSVVNSGTVYSGQSKTISFTARQSFSFTPYWPASQVAKGYTIKVTVQ
jgi:hypothetical protein